MRASARDSGSSGGTIRPASPRHSLPFTSLATIAAPHAIPSRRARRPSHREGATTTSAARYSGAVNRRLAIRSDRRPQRGRERVEPRAFSVPALVADQAKADRPIGQEGDRADRHVLPLLFAQPSHADDERDVFGPVGLVADRREPIAIDPVGDRSQRRASTQHGATFLRFRLRHRDDRIAPASEHPFDPSVESGPASPTSQDQ